MAVDVMTSIEMNCPRAKVAAFSGDPSNAPRWYDNIKSVEWETQPPLRVGSRMAFVAHFLGKRMAYTYELVELSDERLVMRTAQGPFPMETSYEWTELGPNRTRMTLRNRGEPSGFSKLVAPFMASAMRRATEKDLRKLKSLMESD